MTKLTLMRPTARLFMSIHADPLPKLPVCDVLGKLSTALAKLTNAVLIAPPGAGKTTLVPLALVEAEWLQQDKKIIMLEPRRLAARAAAQRIAQLTGSKLGDLVGYRMRMDTKTSAATRIEIVTEGVFTRMILDDPELTGVGCIIFDEFHERSLDADFGLALALEAQSALREDLRVLVMSATLDGARVAELLGDDVPVIESRGRTFPVKKLYIPRRPNDRIEQSVAAAIKKALRDHDGSMLVFLPGRGEIERTRDLLHDVASDSILVAPLFGAMDLKDQAIAIETPPDGVRKIVLATAVAQTSITIEGVKIVVDSGLSREAVFEPRFQTTRLETVKVSQATAEQRAGRAGRTEPGVAIRLWHEGQTRALPPFDPPEIERTDLRRFLLDCAVWGAKDPTSLSLLDRPASSALQQAHESLVQLGALSEAGQLTPIGKLIARIPLPVPLAAMVAAAKSKADAEFRSAVALAIVDLAPTSRELNLEIILRDLQSGRFGKRGKALLQRANAIALRPKLETNETVKPSLGSVLLDAFPDRVAMRRGAQTGSFLMANGRGVRVEEEHLLANEKFLLVVDVIGSAAQGRVMLASTLSQYEIDASLANQYEKRLVLQSTDAGAITARRETRLGALKLSTVSEPVKPSEELEDALCALVIEKGFGILPMRNEHYAMLARLDWLHRNHGEPWVDTSEEVLIANVSKWLKPFLAGKTSLAELSADELRAAIKSLLPAELANDLDNAAPTAFKLPTGRMAQLQYKNDKANPILSVRVQELFGLSIHPSVNNGRIPLLIEMLSPAQRPIQMTVDLPGFWVGSWSEVRKEMRGRYPKHFWPEDPANAAATDRAKPRK